MATIRESLKTDYVREDRFSPIQKLVYGIVALTLTSVVGAVIAMVVSKPR